MKIALELVEMPVRCTVEIGRNGVPDGLASVLGKNSRGFVQYQWSAVGRAEHDPRMAARAVNDGHRQRCGEFARFTAQLQITPARTCRQLRNAHAFDDFVRSERCLEDAG